jgi:hypothetical protein
VDRSALSVKPLAEFFYTGDKKAYPIYGGLASSGKYEGKPLRKTFAENLCGKPLWYIEIPLRKTEGKTVCMTL